ncbi:MAG TPA: 50S ribosomal protein L1 [Candidatus Saccharimonadales bacterium]|nr:50S ribosomal protein L1 [Candidatus Saccharimonadales bacterium]
MAEDKSTEDIINETEAVETPAEETTAPVAAETETTADSEPADEPKAAKAGKRSAKSLAEAEEKEAKEERKAARAVDEAESEGKPKQHSNPTRSRLERQGKNFRKAAEQVDKSKAYSLKDGLELATKTNPVKFDASVELHVNLSVDPRHADQNIRDNLVLPAGTGKTVHVAVMDDAKVEGADISGVETLLASLEKGEINFDILIATPAQMPKLGKFARVLGPRGLMPNPKSGTVTTDVAKAVREAKAGRVEYRVDSTGIVHVAVGKVSFGAKKLEDNARAVLQSIKGNKPNSIKGTYVKAIHLATTMGPSITIDISEL